MEARLCPDDDRPHFASVDFFRRTVMLSRSSAITGGLSGSCGRSLRSVSRPSLMYSILQRMTMSTGPVANDELGERNNIREKHPIPELN